MVEIFNIQKLRINKKIDAYNSAKQIAENVFVSLKVFDNEPDFKNVLVISNKNSVECTIRIKPEDLDFGLETVDLSKNYIIKSPFSDEVFFRTGDEIKNNGFEFVLPPEETFIYHLDGYPSSGSQRYFEALKLILKNRVISLTYLKKYIKSFDFLQILKTILFHESPNYS